MVYLKQFFCDALYDTKRACGTQRRVMTAKVFVLSSSMHYRTFGLFFMGLPVGLLTTKPNELI